MSRLLALALVLASPAAADGCWLHEGSVLRLHAAGDYRAFVVERPGARLRGAGVRPGAKLFEGVDEGGWLLGSVRDLAVSCEGRPRLFYAEGFLLDDPPRLSLAGEREVFEGCRPTGRWEAAVVSLTYSHECSGSQARHVASDPASP